MRHRKKKNKISRSASHRSLMIRGQMNALFEHGSIETTQTKAKLVSASVDRLLSRVKKASSSQVAKQYLHEVLASDVVEKKVISDIVPQYKDRSSGFTRIIKLGRRKGDNALTVQLELV